MKDFLFKEKKLKKIVAILIVFVMVISPFVDTAGYRDGARADEGVPEAEYVNLSFCENAGGTYGVMPVSDVDDDGVFHLPYGNYRFTFEAKNEVASAGNCKIKLFLDGISVDSGVTVTYESGKYIVGFTIDSSNGILLSEEPKSVTAKIFGETEDKKSEIVLPIQKIQKVKDTPCDWKATLIKGETDVFNGAGTMLPKVSSDNKYQLKISYVSSDKISNVKFSWKNNNIDGTFDYTGYSEKRDNADGLYRDTYIKEIPSNVDAIEILKDLKVTYDYEDMSEGYVKVSEATYPFTSGEIIYDGELPVVTALDGSVTLQESENDGSTWTNVSSDIKYLDTGHKYKYVVNASDEGTGIGKVYLHKVGSGYDTDVEMTLSGTSYEKEIELSSTEFEEYVAYAVDKAGNKSEEFPLQKVMLIDTALKIVSIELLDENGNLIDNPSGDIVTNKKRQIKVTATSGDEINNITLIKKDKSSTETTLKKDATREQDSETKLWKAVCTFDIPKGTLSTTEYLKDMSIKADDINKNSVTEYISDISSIFYDGIAPVAEKPVVAEGNIGELEVSSDNGATWAPVDTAEIKSGVFYTEVTKKYRYKVKVTDEGSGIDKVYVAEDETKPFNKLDETTYVLPVIPTVDNETNYQVVASDKAGNVSAPLQLQKIRQQKNALTVEVVLKEKDDTTPIPYKDTYLYTNKKHVVEVTAASGYLINKITLNIPDIPSIEKTFTPADNVDAEGNRYKVTHTFEIPADVSVNAVFKDMTVTVSDAGNTEVTSDKIQTIVFDNTDPIDIATETLPTGWVKSYQLRSAFSSGNGTVESPIENAKYSISNSVANVTNESIAHAADALTANKDITVPCSTSTQGTTVSFDVSDKAGNSKAFEKTIKVDNKLPSGNIRVNNATAFDNPLNALPVVKYSYSDNLTIDVAKIVVTGSDGTEKEKTLASNKEQVNISDSGEYNLSDIYGTNIPDGEYTVSLVVTDKAGNSASVSKIEFILDRTRPIVKKPAVSTLICSEDGGLTWSFVNINSENTYKGVYYTNPDYIYRYAVTATDEGSGFGSVYTTVGGRRRNLTRLEVENEIYYTIDISPQLDEVLSYEVTAVDRAGNTAIMPVVTQKVTLTNREFVASVRIYDSKDKAVDPKDLPKYMSEAGYKIRVTTSSGYEIRSIALNRKNGDNENDNLVFMGFSAPNNVKDATNRYSVVYDISIPTNVNVNEWFSSAYIVVKDSNYENNTLRFPEKGRLFDVIYDVTKPTISVNTSTKWVNSYKFKYTIKSGDSGAEEAPLSSVTYTISDSVNNEKGVIKLANDQKSVSGELKIPESANTTGTHIVIKATDVAGNAKTFVYDIKLDETNPYAETLLDGKKSIDKPINTVPAIKISYGDNISIAKATVTIDGPLGEKTKNIIGNEIISLNIDNVANYKFTDIYGKKIPDGEYTVKVLVRDKAGNKAKTNSIRFSLDRTKPVISSKIKDGVKSPKKGGYYNTNVKLAFTLDEMSDCTIKILDNDSPINVAWDNDGASRDGVITISGEGSHNISYTVTDDAGNTSSAEDIKFTIDKSKPVILASVNGSVYSESAGVNYLGKAATVAITVNDSNVDLNDINYRVTFTSPDGRSSTSQYKKTADTSFSYSEQGDYLLEIYAIDKANNKGDVTKISFRIDSDAPVINIIGLGDGAINHSETISFEVEEVFFRDVTASVSIYRKQYDGAQETLYKTLDIVPTGTKTTVSETFDAEGDYRFEFSASDKAGHTAKKSEKLIIDLGSPVMDVVSDASGIIKDFGKTKEPVEFTIKITDAFYEGNQVTIVATRTDASGNVKDFEIPVTGLNTSLVEIPVRFDIDGIYDIEIKSKDAAGNESVYSLSHFILDTTAPDLSKIEGALAEYEGKKVKSFDIFEDIDSLIDDLTVCQSKMLLNGSEFDGNKALEDGSYTFDITVTDEMDFVSELKGISFEVDSKAPTFIVVGVEDKDVKNETYNIEVSLQLDEDILSSVTLNGKEMSIDNNVSNITVDSKGNYELVMKAHDEAGNEAVQTISFKYGKNTSILLFVIIGLGVVLAGTVIFLVIRKKSKN